MGIAMVEQKKDWGNGEGKPGQIKDCLAKIVAQEGEDKNREIENGEDGDGETQGAKILNKAREGDAKGGGSVANPLFGCAEGKQEIPTESTNYVESDGEVILSLGGRRSNQTHRQITKKDN